MSFCPKCRFEYEPGVTVCPDCNEALVDVLPDIEGKESEYRITEENAAEWIPIAVLSSPEYAHMIEEALRAKNIPVVIRSGAGHFGPIGALGTSSVFAGSGGYLVLVREKYVTDADREASTILGDIWEKSKTVNLDE